MQQNDINYNIRSPGVLSLKHKLIKPSFLGVQQSLSNDPKIIKNSIQKQKIKKKLSNQKINTEQQQSLDLQSLLRQLRQGQNQSQSQNILPIISHKKKKHQPTQNISFKQSKILKSYVDVDLNQTKKNNLKQQSQKYDFKNFLKGLKKKTSIVYQPSQLSRKNHIKSVQNINKIQEQQTKRRFSQNKKILIQNQTQIIEYKTSFPIKQKSFYYLFSKCGIQTNNQQSKTALKPHLPPLKNRSSFWQNYQPFSGQIDIKQLKKNNFCTIQDNQNYSYFGEIASKMKTGKGIFIQKQRCFQGLWKCNQKVKGAQMDQVGIYKGNFVNDQREGPQGQFLWNTGQNFIGQWKKDLMNGIGFWIDQKGTSYKGQWKNGKATGIGFLIQKSNKYRGGFLNFKKHGFGRMYFKNNDYYQGHFKSDLPSGRGKYIWSHGVQYEGDFSHGKRHGFGQVKLQSGLIYKGQFMDDKLFGDCEILYPNGDVYYGMIENGKKNGKGILKIYKNKVVMNGYWKDDCFVQNFL